MLNKESIMKKFLAALLCAVTAFTLVGLTGCNKKSETVNVYVVDGAPVLSVANLLKEEEIDGVKLNVKIVPSAENLVAAVTNKDADIAVCPVNLASNLYNKGLNVKLLSVNITGVLHLVGKQDATFESLKGKTVYNIGAGGTPDITLKYLIKSAGLEYTENLDAPEADKINIKYVSAAGELIPLLKQNKAEYGVIGEPAASNAYLKVEGLKSVMDLTEEWNKVNSGVLYTQAGVTVNGDFLKNNKKFVKSLYEKLTDNKHYCLENPSTVKAAAIDKGSALQIDFTAEIIDRCNLTCLKAIDEKQSVEKYLSVLSDFDPKTIGGKLPDDNFYAKI